MSELILEPSEITLILEPTRAFKTLRLFRLREWRGRAIGWYDGVAQVAHVDAWSTFAPFSPPEGGLFAGLAASEAVSDYRGIAARLWQDGRGGVLHLAVVKAVDLLDQFPPRHAAALERIAAELAALSPEKFESLRDDPAAVAVAS